MTYEQIADKAGLDSHTKRRYVQYMKTRWANDEKVKCKTGYALEWAYRFKLEQEYLASDSEGKAVLKNIDSIKTDTEMEKFCKETAEQVWEAFRKEIEDNKKFRDALKIFIQALEGREEEWLKKILN